MISILYIFIVATASAAIWLVTTAALVAHFQPKQTITEIKCCLGGAAVVAIFWGVLWAI